MNYIAERKLLFSEKGSEVRKEVTIKVCFPYLVKQEDVEFEVDGTISCCNIEIDGIEARGLNFYGMDSLQAINIASNIEPLLERLSKKHDFFWVTGEPYFDE